MENLYNSWMWGTL